MTLSGKSAEICTGAVLKAAILSGLTPVFKWVRLRPYVPVKLPMDMKTNSVRCSIAFAAAWVMLELKFIKYCSLSMAVDTLEELLPLLSVYTV